MLLEMIENPIIIIQGTIIYMYRKEFLGSDKFIESILKEFQPVFSRNLLRELPRNAKLKRLKNSFPDKSGYQGINNLTPS